MKDLKMCYSNADYGQVFWDQDEKWITSIHENDANFKEEYMSELLTHFGIKIVFKKKIPKSVKEASKNSGIWDYEE